MLNYPSEPLTNHALSHTVTTTGSQKESSIRTPKNSNLNFESLYLCCCLLTKSCLTVWTPRTAAR